MSRRNDLLKSLIASDKFGKEKENEQKFLVATAELILMDLIDIACKGVEKWCRFTRNQSLQRLNDIYVRSRN